MILRGEAFRDVIARPTEDGAKEQRLVAAPTTQTVIPVFMLIAYILASGFMYIPCRLPQIQMS